MKTRIIAVALVLSLQGGALSAGLMADLGLEPFRVDSGARPLALGQAFTGRADDENTAFYNPGGLPWSKGITASMNGQGNIAAAQAYPTGYGTTLGIAVAQTGVSSYTASSGSIADLSSSILVLSAGSKLSSIPFLDSVPDAKNIGIGANLKAILGQTLRVLGSLDRTAQGWEMDVGGMYRMNPWLSLGLSLNNILPKGDSVSTGGSIRWDTGELEAVPASAKIGISAAVIGDARSPLYLEGSQVFLNADIRAARERNGSAGLGIEWNYMGAFSVRAGYSGDEMSFGAGARFGGWGVDAASFSDPLKKTPSFAVSVLYDPEEWVFEIKPPEPPKFTELRMHEPIVYLTPSSETTTYESMIQLSGKVKPDLEVAVNGQAVALDSENRFEVLSPLNPGKNLILVDISRGKEKKTVEIKVLRKAKIVIAEERSIEEEIKRARTASERERLRKELEEVKERKQKVESLVTMGVIDVAPEKDFSLEAPVTRGELASWLVRSADIPLARVTAPVFADVPAGHEYAPFIKAASDRGLMRARNNRFEPDAPVSRAEAEEIFRRFGVIR